MKKILWKPSKISWQIHVVITIFAIICIILIEVFKVENKQPYYRQKIKAAILMKNGMDILKKYRVKHIGPINKKIDPTKSGLIGVNFSPITSKKGNLDAKINTINPNWAAVMVMLLKKADVKKGDTVAVSFSGSFPAINLAVLSAAKAMNLKLIIISSISASTWGANIPKFSWLDMEIELYNHGLFPYRTIAASLGGIKDMGLGMPEEGKAFIRKEIRSHGITLLEFEDIKENIESRMMIYRENAGDNPIAAFINVGGGITAFGNLVGKRHYKPGLNLKPPRRAILIESVMSRFARESIPIIYMTHIKTLAKKYVLPANQQTIPKVGIGEIYSKPEYNKMLVSLALIILLFLLYVLIRMGFGYRIFTASNKEVKQIHHGPMV